MMKRLLALLSLVALGGCATLHEPTPTTARWWLTTADQSQKLAEQPPIPLGAGPATAVTIHVDPGQRFQSIVGFGAAITDASAILIQAMPAARRQALLDELFGRRGEGLGLSFTRLTVGASDFSPTHYSLDDSPGNVPDPELKYYSIEPARRAMLPTVRQALAINPDLKIMISPWSAPAWMKTSRSLITGKLDPVAYPAFAAYLARTVEEFGRDGVPVTALTIQNEPDFEPDSYPGMRMSAADRAAVIGGHLGPLFERRGIKTQILDWDHNWDEPQMPLGTLADPRANGYISGIAWHCYNGDVAAQSKVRDAYPDKDAWFTECSGGEWSPKFDETLAWMTRNLVIGATRNWARGVLLWNLALDPQHGPHLGGCGDCRGVVTIDPASGTVVSRNVEYYVLGHASRFVRQGARRIASDSGVSDVDTVAFLNPDGRTIVVIAFNGAASPRDVTLATPTESFPVRIPPGSVVTVTWRNRAQFE
ncbi:MAG: glycoside hydrolase family 30 beta sandwich domain-containing protein [Sphingomicrobium sp.]